MLLFRKEHVAPILAGEKTITRRMAKKPRWKCPSIHQAKLNYTSPPFALLEIWSFRRITIDDIPEDEKEVYRNDYFRNMKPGYYLWEVEFRCIVNGGKYADTRPEDKDLFGG